MNCILHLRGCFYIITNFDHSESRNDAKALFHEGYLFKKRTLFMRVVEHLHGSWKSSVDTVTYTRQLQLTNISAREKEKLTKYMHF